MSKQFRLSLDETAKLLGSSNCSLGNSTLDKCLSSMRGGGHGKPTNSPTNHLKAHGDVSWDKYSSVTNILL